ncbi:MAG: L,D-transpeptidase family protein [Saccharofermentans sp.]|nr:L,D-transpeptidase family protein [Saccharofermentans sp.]
MKKIKVMALAALMTATLVAAGCRFPIPSVNEPTMITMSGSETASETEITVSSETTTAVAETTAETTKAPVDEKLPGQDFDVREELFKLRGDQTCKQVLFIRCDEGTKGFAQYLVKTEEEGSVAWKITRECNAYIGLNGPGKTKEGDTKTPLGVFGVRGAFGIRSNPGTKLPFIRITPDTYACGCEKYYNRIIDAKVTGHKCTEGEQMYYYSPEYNYGIETDFNTNNEYGKGSAVFIHCMGVKPYTGGCIALPEDDMKYILQDAEPGLKIIIQKF